MQNEFRERQRKTTANMRMMRDITMAILIIGMAILLFFAKRWNLLVHLSDGFRITLGVLFAIYGAFRLYRGIKQDY
ncbi:MAG TPA: hypothetical protein VF145_07185 [Chitinophagaceae bacterium]